MTLQLKRVASIAVVAYAAAVFLAACAGHGPAPRELPRCNPQESLVCYGKEASRVDRQHRLEDVEFCHCERVLP